jgi:hypothetical protein
LKYFSVSERTSINEPGKGNKKARGLGEWAEGFRAD